MDDSSLGRRLVEIKDGAGWQALMDIVADIEESALEKLDASEQDGNLNRGIRRGLAEMKSRVDDCISAWEKSGEKNEPETTL